MKIVIVNYNMGNPSSIANMIKRIGYESKITSEHEVIKNADKLILPGVGSFDKAIENLEVLNLIELLNEKVLIKKVSVLGICLGMQLLTHNSEEGKLKGFGWINATTVKFSNNEFTNLKYPHMGWNLLNIKKEHPLFYEMYDDPRFYFVHSYYVNCNNERDILTTTEYGIQFCSSIAKENIMGVQFHPEKSHKYGLKLLKNFIEKI